MHVQGLCLTGELACAGVGMGCLAVGATGVTDAMMLAAARGIVHKLTEEELAAESVLPRIERIRWRFPTVTSQQACCIWLHVSCMHV